MKDEAPAVGIKVRINAAGHARLGPTRKRDQSVTGTVVGWEERQRRTLVRWLDDTPYEPFPPQYLDEVTA